MGDERKTSKTQRVTSCSALLFFILHPVYLFFFPCSVSPALFLPYSLPFSARGRKIVERSIYGYKITHVKFEAGRVYLKDLCASSGERGRRETSGTRRGGRNEPKFFEEVRCELRRLSRTATTIASLFTRNNGSARVRQETIVKFTRLYVVQLHVQIS